MTEMVWRPRCEWGFVPDTMYPPHLVCPKCGKKFD